MTGTSPILHAEIDQQHTHALQLRLQRLVLQLESHMELIREP
jgi:hypothetical protein